MCRMQIWLEPSEPLYKMAQRLDGSPLHDKTQQNMAAGCGKSSYAAAAIDLLRRHPPATAEASVPVVFSRTAPVVARARTLTVALKG